MPELPDVEIFKKYFNRTSLNKKIHKVDIYSKKMLNGVSAGSLRKNLRKNLFRKTERHGKYLFVYTNKRKILVFHFGMTGSLQYYKNDAKKPKYSRMLISFKNGYHLAYDCPRKLGKIFLIDGKQKFIEDKRLGPDPFEDEFNLTGFRTALGRKRGTIKSVLMDQKTIAGIGNIYSDEILFHAGIHPASKTEKLKEHQVKKIYLMMNKVLSKAIDAHAESERMPGTYLLSSRQDGSDCPGCNGKIRKKTIGGRSSYFCDTHQKIFR